MLSLADEGRLSFKRKAIITVGTCLRRLSPMHAGVSADWLADMRQ